VRERNDGINVNKGGYFSNWLTMIRKRRMDWGRITKLDKV